MSKKGVVEYFPAFLARAPAKLIEATAVSSQDLEDSLDTDAAHIKRLEQIAIHAEEVAAEHRQQAKQMTEEAAVRRRDFEEAKAEFAQRLKSEGLLP